MPLPEPTRLELEAIDAALAGERVDPQHAELAELALLLADARPRVPAASAAELDRRFTALRATQGRARRRGPARRPWLLRPAVGAGLALATLLAVAVIVLPHHGGSRSSSDSSSGPAQVLSSHGAASSSAGSSASSSSNAASGSNAPSSAGASSSAGAAGAVAPAAAPSPAATVPTPQPNGRRIVQTSQLSLSAPTTQLGAVSQELFDAVGAEQGIVKRSQVTSGTGGFASFTLSIPTQNLSVTLSRLARLRGTRVLSSSASTTDVNSQYLDDQRRLADAKALRGSLLTQLQAAVSTTAVDSLKAQIATAESTISKDEATLNRLQGRISYSTVDVQINAAAVAVTAARSRAGGFSIARGAHDALDVLKVAAGVLLIALAVLVPLSLVAALLAWLGLGWRRYRRERALDAT
jgi:hypothetical protein